MSPAERQIEALSSCRVLVGARSLSHRVSCLPMPYAYEIDVDQRLVIAMFSGDATIADARAVMAELYADPRHSFALNRVYDCRELTRLPSLSELRGVADLFQQRVDAAVPSRRAIVVRAGAPYGLGRMLQALLDLVGFELNVFSDVDEAIAWASNAGPRIRTDAGSHG